MVTNVTAPPGGVMTDEVGTITGDLALEPEVAADGLVRLRVQYQGADEWYTVTGASARVPDPADQEAVERAEEQLIARFAG